MGRRAAGSPPAQHRGKWADHAVLYRGNHQARVIEQQLRQQKIPYMQWPVVFDKAEIKTSPAICA